MVLVQEICGRFEGRPNSVIDSLRLALEQAGFRIKRVTPVFVTAVKGGISKQAVLSMSADMAVKTHVKVMVLADENNGTTVIIDMLRDGKMSNVAALDADRIAVIQAVTTYCEGLDVDSLRVVRDQVLRVFRTEMEGSAPQGLIGARNDVFFQSDKGVIKLDPSSAVTFATIGAMIVNDTPKLKKPILRGVRLVIDRILSQMAGLAFPEMISDPDELAAIEMIRRQSVIRSLLPMRLSRECVDCGKRVCINPAHREVEERNRRIKGIGGALGGAVMMFGSGLGFGLVLTNLIGVVNLELDYHCNNCDSMLSSDRPVVMCKGCGCVNGAALLGVCSNADCGSDMRVLAERESAELFWSNYSVDVSLPVAQGNDRHAAVLTPQAVMDPAGIGMKPVDVPVCAADDLAERQKPVVGQAADSSSGSMQVVAGQPQSASGSIAPGWHPNPDGSASERWWSGSDWTNQVRPTSASVVQHAVASVMPGWYPNPDGSASERWWSGSDWTNQVRPMSRQQLIEHAKAAAMAMSPNVDENGSLRLPGWYLDPAGSGSMRWWDGRNWTHFMR